MGDGPNDPAWQVYSDNMTGRKIKKNGVYSLEHCNKLGQSSDMESLSVQDIDQIKKFINGKGDMTNGLVLKNGQEKYTVVASGDGVAVFRGKGDVKDKQMTACSSNQVILLGICTENDDINPRSVRDEIEKLTSYLKGVNS